eukprot:10200589-Lingulodinium_polyedra.AAC.1
MPAARRRRRGARRGRGPPSRGPCGAAGPRSLATCGACGTGGPTAGSPPWPPEVADGTAQSALGQPRHAGAAAPRWRPGPARSRAWWPGPCRRKGPKPPPGLPGAPPPPPAASWPESPAPGGPGVRSGPRVPTPARSPS